VHAPFAVVKEHGFKELQVGRTDEGLLSLRDAEGDVIETVYPLEIDSTELKRWWFSGSIDGLRSDDGGHADARPLPPAWFPFDRLDDEDV
jgi:hypothetical protein